VLFIVNYINNSYSFI